MKWTEASFAFVAPDAAEDLLSSLNFLRKANQVDLGLRVGGVSAVSFRALSVARFFCSSVRTFFFGLALTFDFVASFFLGFFFTAFLADFFGAAFLGLAVGFAAMETSDFGTVALTVVA